MYLLLVDKIYEQISQKFDSINEFFVQCSAYLLLAKSKFITNISNQALNRRKALKNLISTGVVAGIGFSTYKFYRFEKISKLKELTGYKELIAELAETIVPATDTPGAKEANVQLFIMNAVTNVLSTAEQNRFIDGLADVEDYSMDKYDKRFVKCSLVERNQILSHFESKAMFKSPLINKINNKFFGQPFFTRLKMLTVYGYCTSQLGATKGLAYDYIPGGFQSNIPIGKNQKSWATK